MEKESSFVPEVRGQARALALLIAQNVRDYFKNEEHRKEFEVWYLSKYGKPYQWVSVSQKKSK